MSDLATGRDDLSGLATLGEEGLDEVLRPRSLAEMVGQDRLRENLDVFIRAARERREALDHVLLHGPPGLGKTSLAHVVAREMGAPLRVTSGPAIERAGDLAALLSNLERGDVLFMDEIHRLPAAVEEILYPAMEVFKLDIIIDQGPNARSVRLILPRFTLIGATTRSGLLTAPLFETVAEDPQKKRDVVALLQNNGGGLCVGEQKCIEVITNGKRTIRGT